jgi:hypothetical protein
MQILYELLASGVVDAVEKVSLPASKPSEGFSLQVAAVPPELVP